MSTQVPSAEMHRQSHLEMGRGAVAVPAGRKGDFCPLVVRENRSNSEDVPSVTYPIDEIVPSKSVNKKLTIFKTGFVVSSYVIVIFQRLFLC